MRRMAVIAWLSGVFLVIAGIFWYNEWVYALPTPIPKDYAPVRPGSRVTLPAALTAIGAMNTGRPRPLFLHFFNPDCPCSKFNIPQFKSLVAKYEGQVDFAVVLMSAGSAADRKYSADEVNRRFGLSLPVLTDSSLAAGCGVYSTPQAVLLTADHRLFYRGNYNRGRYCADPSTNYAGQAMEALLHNIRVPEFSPLALRSYGCRLPNCTR